MKLALLYLVLLAAAARAATFRLTDTQQTCFYEEIGYNSEVVVGEIVRKRNEATDNIPVKLIVTTDESTAYPVYSATVRPGSSTFSFKPNPQAPAGMYPLCFSVEQKGWIGNDNMYIELALLVDHHDRLTIVPKQEAAITRTKVHKDDEVFVFTDFDGQPKETLRTHAYLERVNELLSGVAYTVEEIRSEVKHFEERTLRMRETSESTFERVWLTSVITIGVVTVVSWVQFSFLKSFLKRKKLV
jgi:hypothetical protein